MTIGAGFRCKNGIVLCADTHIVWQGWYKRTATKITKVSVLNNRLMFVHAGIVPSAKTLIRRIAIAIRATKPNRMSDIEACIQAECHGFRKQRRERYSPQLLVAIRGQKRAYLYSIADYKLDRVDDACCIGTGAGVVNRVLDSYDPQMTVKEATFVAVYVAKEAKDFGSSVGGSTQVVQIFDDDRWDIVQDSEIDRLENDYVAAQRLLGRLLTKYTPMFSPESWEFKQMLHQLTSLVHRAHKNRGHLVGKYEQAQLESTEEGD